MDQVMSFIASTTNAFCFAAPEQRKTVQYFDIDHLSRLAQEESYTMPRGLTREQRRQWARQNIQR